MLHLADLLAEESFHLELMSGGQEAAKREVRGAHAVEVEAPTRWLGPDWIMRTTGVRLRRKIEVDGWHAVATPVVTRADLAARWLVLTSTRRGFINKLAKPAAEATAPLLAALARLGDVVRDQEQAVKAALLAEALEPVEARDLLPLAARTAAFGLDFSDPARLVSSGVTRAAARRAGWTSRRSGASRTGKNGR